MMGTLKATQKQSTAENPVGPPQATHLLIVECRVLGGN